MVLETFCLVLLASWSAEALSPSPLEAVPYGIVCVMSCGNTTAGHAR
jgi:hypothetical protein